MPNESDRSLHVLLHDAWHLVSRLDGSLWRALKLLLLRPGQLTLAYVAAPAPATCRRFGCTASAWRSSHWLR